MRILIAQTSFLGDVVLSTPVFAGVRRHHPHAHVTVLARPDTVGVLEGHPAVDAIIIDDKRGRARGLGSLRVVRDLRRGRFDLALALHKSFRTAWMLAAAGIPRRIGFRRSAGWFFYHRCVARDATRHDVERNLAILAGIDIDPRTVVSRPFVACPPGATARLEALLRDHDVPPAARLIGVAPGSAWATKRWTAEGYGALLDDVCRELGAIPVLLGAPTDVPYAEAVQHAASGRVINLVGQTDLGTLIAAIDRCLVLVTNDSAPMHIAVARNTPVVAVFGPTTPAQGYGPYTDRAVIVERALSCRPCSRHGGALCPIGTHACMREISHADVLRAVRELAGRDSAAPQRAAARR
jgi:lipopolysaccharide heptosyltransferase II